IKELPDSSLADIFRAIELLGKYTDRPKTAAGLVRALRRDLDRLSRRRPARSLRVLVVVGAMPTVPGAVYVAGPGSYLDSIIRLAGHSNALQGRLDRPWAQVSVEALVAAGPEAILESRADSSPAAMERLYRAWSDFAGSIPALRDRRICCIADESILIPGPRVNIALWRVMRALAGRGGAD
ncbi:MAG: ABC transporter substrate-binding protein, partial [Phycisphaerae bacterium]